ncbi:putative quinol monooxygenase [Paralysiella testudinis]|uniref:Antibiotic biosynthesis monooxygenase n=1 Tax=Paralysiella testudinis TaxID=2809020 RepID=A0A892ZFK0_9NEIS|nr:antibiotic biosynthesis monooxygenase [Paralysiella testudinis]QRQ81413.1 antibiotic biosynthesis monooxygenase [Paralysiella testudinis]
MKITHAAACLSALAIATAAQAAPLVRIFELSVHPAEQAAFANVGIDNLSTSIRNEPGTLAMYAAQRTDRPSEHIVVEIYRDEAAYRIHADSPQFKRFAEVAKNALAGRKMWETEPQFLMEKPTALYAINNQRLKINLAEITVKPEHNAAFRKIVMDEMRQSMAQERGVLAMYAVTLKNAPNEWRFFEIYADENVYLAHRQTPHFQGCLKATAEMVRARKVIELQGGTLVNQGGLRFDD